MAALVLVVLVAISLMALAWAPVLLSLAAAVGSQSWWLSRSTKEPLSSPSV
jgi:hypothetical protein